MTTTTPHTENLTPKQRFQLDANALSRHRDLIASDDFKRAVDTAMLQYQIDLTVQCKDPNAAMRVGLCMLGAQELISVIRQLAETSVAVKRTVNDNLIPN